MQAGGRVIRSDTDKGAILLIDDRYLNATYQELFKDKWSHYYVLTSNDDIKTTLKNFWKTNDR